MHYQVDTLKNRYNYLDEIKELNRKSWPEFILHGDTPSWGNIYDELSEFVLLLINSEGYLIGAGLTIPASWTGNSEELPASIESVVAGGLKIKDRSPNTLIAVAALVDETCRGEKLSAEILKQMKNLAKHFAIQNLIVPVRPTWKARYPLQSIESYANWQRDDGLCYDPWLRTHQRLGAKFLKCADTMKVEGSIEDWQTWTGMIFPESGDYVVKGALQPVTIEVASDIGVYHDPNVWMQHTM
ncbi:MAG: hypothetical protein GY795_00370 [Desulfobacterales bacterium]|nr:hypothetical protein [Desulfobacterales bacterium]